MDNYESLDGIRRSDLWKMNGTPARFKYEMDHKDEAEPSKALTFGIAAHCYILTPEQFYVENAVLPQIDRRTKAGKETYLEFCEANEGKNIITLAEFEQIRAMDAELKSDPLAVELLNGIHEKAFQWVDSLTEEACKVKADCLTEYDGKKFIVDYKTTESCEDGHFERSARMFGYDFQAGMYREGVQVNTLDDYGFIFIAQEKKEPYLHRIYFCSDGFIEQGYDKFRELIGLYHQCKVTDTWNGYESTELLERGEPNG